MLIQILINLVQIESCSTLHISKFNFGNFGMKQIFSLNKEKKWLWNEPLQKKNLVTILIFIFAIFQQVRQFRQVRLLVFRETSSSYGYSGSYVYQRLQSNSKNSLLGILSLGMTLFFLLQAQSFQASPLWAYPLWAYPLWA